MKRVLSSSAGRRPRTRRVAAARLAALVVVSAAAGAASAQTGAYGIDYRSAGASLIVRDAPSVQGRTLFRLLPGTPVEVVVSQNGWVRIRDPQGSMNWVESHALGDQRTVIVTAERATIRRQPQADAPPAFEAVRNVVLQLIEPAALGWARVRHAEGLEGYVRASEVWGL